MTAPRILIIGANGQIGTELAEALVQRHGADAVITSDLAPEGRVQRVRHHTDTLRRAAHDSHVLRVVGGRDEQEAARLLR